MVREGSDVMEEKRRDSKGRLLRKGEWQRKDGRYTYRYVDGDGKRRCVYSWRLDKNDRAVKGHLTDLSLREKERAIAAAIR